MKYRLKYKYKLDSSPYFHYVGFSSKNTCFSSNTIEYSKKFFLKEINITIFINNSYFKNEYIYLKEIVE